MAVIGRTSLVSLPRSRRRAFYYTLACLLPCLCSWLATRVHALYDFPIALHFLTIIVVAILGGFGPGLASVFMTVIARLVQGSISSPPLTPRADVFRFVILLAEALLLGSLSHRRRASEERLEGTLEQLQARTDDLVATLSSSKCACWTLDMNTGGSARWFRGSHEIFGRPFEEIEAMPRLAPLLHPDDQLRLPLLSEQMLTSFEPIIWEYRCPWPDGEMHTLEMRATRVPGPGCVWRGVTLDITERKQAENALLRAEKLAAMGRLASTVAHEINNPLEAVTNLLYLANTHNDTMDATTREYLRSAERELARLSQITRHTLGFIRTSAKPTEIELSTTVEQVLAIFQYRLQAKDVEVEREYKGGVFVSIAEHELRQIVTNLIANAADALTARGARIALRIFAEDDTAVLLVEDDGCGIDEQHLPRLFEPFFTTKDDVGTGIGLWVSRELVEKNGGRISLEREGLPANFSTRFRVELPLAAEPVEAQAGAAAVS